jgi:hypothetical protein
MQVAGRLQTFRLPLLRDTAEDLSPLIDRLQNLLFAVEWKPVVGWDMVLSSVG